MRVVLRHPGIGLYYAGRKHWVSNPASAMDAKTIEEAADLSRGESFDEMDIVVTYEDPCCELILPVRRKVSAVAEPLREAA